MSNSFIAFKPEDASDALKSYDGQIIATDYSEEPLGMAGAATIQRKGKVFCIKLQTDQYEKPQFEWYPPSKVKQTKWVNFIESLVQVGAMKDVNASGATDEERMKNFGASLLGMKFHWEERKFTSLVKEQGKDKEFSLLVPTTYMGKLPIQAAPVVAEATIGENLK